MFFASTVDTAMAVWDGYFFFFIFVAQNVIARAYFLISKWLQCCVFAKALYANFPCLFAVWWECASAVVLTTLK